jgi:hypothetical protein
VLRQCTRLEQPGCRYWPSVFQAIGRLPSAVPLWRCRVQSAIVAVVPLRSGRRGSVTGSLQGLSILVVEDEPLIAVDIASTFRSEGATVVVAHNCKEAIQALTNKPSIAVLDIIQDGELDKLKELLKAAGIRYLTYSGYTPTE